MYTEWVNVSFKMFGYQKCKDALRHVVFQTNAVYALFAVNGSNRTRISQLYHNLNHENLFINIFENVNSYFHLIVFNTAGTVPKSNKRAHLLPLFSRHYRLYLRISQLGIPSTNWPLKREHVIPNTLMIKLRKTIIISLKLMSEHLKTTT